MFNQKIFCVKHQILPLDLKMQARDSKQITYSCRQVAMDDGKKVWVPHPTEGYKLGRIVDIGADGITVEPFQTPGQVLHFYSN